MFIECKSLCRIIYIINLIYAESFKKVIDMYETLDILVNIAGIMDDADWEIMVDVNYVRDFCILYINLI